MNTKTIINGKEYEQYDIFKKWLEELKQEFINQKDYKGFPVLPNDCKDGYQYYLNSDEIERTFIFNTLLNEFIEAIRHWKVDKDMLWTEKGRKDHTDFLEKINLLLPYMKKDWDKFW
jgi:hypothetical protein